MSHIDADLETLLDFADAYASLGADVHEQVHHVLDGTDTDSNVNVNAIQAAYQGLAGYHEDLSHQLKRWLDENA